MFRVPPISMLMLTAILGIFIASLADPAKAQLPGRFLFGPDNSQIKQCNIDGSNCFNVVQYDVGAHPAEASQPSIANNGTIAFEAIWSIDQTCVVATQGICPPHVFLMDPDGTNVRQITFNPNPASNFGGDKAAAISPDGSMVAFVASRNAASDGTVPRALYAVNADGSGLHQVTPFSYDGNGQAHGSMQSAAWSPDSKQLAFKGSIIGTFCGTSFGSPIESEIVGTINVNGTGQTYRACFSVNEAGSAWGIDWSPDGTLIAYAHNSINFGEPAIGFIDLSGQGRFANGLTTAQLGIQAANSGELCFSDVHCLHFSPDSARLAYENNSPSDNPSFNGISTIKLDGTGRLDSFNFGGAIQNGMWWAPGAALPAAAQFTLAPNPTQVWPGHSQQLTPSLADSHSNLILHTAASYTYSVDYGTSGCIKIGPYGLVFYGGSGNGSGSISTTNAGLTSNSVTFQCFASPPCTFTLGSTSANLPANGGPSMVGVTTSNSGSCPWTATSNASWITITSGSSGSGNGMVGFSVAANTVPTQRVGTITIADQTMTVTQAAALPTMSLNRSTLNFGNGGGKITSPQSVTVTFNASGVSWTVSSSQANITVSPASGTGNGVFQITAAAGPSGMVTVTASGVGNSPQQIQVNVVSVTPAMPFGSFDTPINNTSGIAGAVGVTGWGLDSIEVTSIGIWREPVPGEATAPNGLVFIGNANFVADARPDVAATFPSSPYQYRGGWGYMLLTNFLPNSTGSGPLGNGTYKLHIIMTNKSGTAVDLGTRTITVDNAHASKPFGTIDTPDQGGSATGNAFVNFGWALTQNPDAIPIDGSTITVILDGVPVGHPTYNNYRSDIANLFPGLANSNGAVGFFVLDTTRLQNKVHTISWNAFDNAGRGDGLGSRYFTVFNANGGGVAAPDGLPTQESLAGPVKLRSGYGFNAPQMTLTPDASGYYAVDMDQLGRIELSLGASRGYLVGAETEELPVGSSLKAGVFYWQAPLGFLGKYELLFDRPDATQIRVRVNIVPKQYSLQ